MVQRSGVGWRPCDVCFFLKQEVPSLVESQTEAVEDNWGLTKDNTSVCG